MPQMNPMSWVSLFLLISLSIFLFFMVIYFLPNPSSMPLTCEKQTPKITWKW